MSTYLDVAELGQYGIEVDNGQIVNAFQIANNILTSYQLEPITPETARQIIPQLENITF